ncbi:MAG: hypothetical protein JWQ71_1349 [Pedosphaera sp.]|nr:hypothetical protein [Pedosphaera sp.]
MDVVNNSSTKQQWPAGRSAIWIGICALISLYVIILAVELALRVRFPWDLYFWPESPFLTNMMKLNQHLPVYTAPADGNSFVYSPGLEYLTYALLKPFGLQLDIRFCRLINVLLGVIGAGCAALAMSRLSRSTTSMGKTRLFFFVSWGIVLLVLFKNFLAEIPHPDTIHTLHALLVFWLCLAALETKRFRLAIITMAVAGVGVLTKQTEALCLLGPAVVFAIFNPWGWRRWTLLMAVGGAVFGISLYLLWLPQYGRFFTFYLPSHQGISLRKLYTLTFDLLSMHGGILLFLGVIAGFCLWSARNESRRYLACWISIGFFTVLPNLAAYLKAMGTWNNLCIFEVWLILIVWPFFCMLLDSLALVEPKPEKMVEGWNRQVIPWSLCLLTIFLVLLLLPTKMPPQSGHYKYCQTIDEALRRDIQANRKVLVSHGSEFLIRAGVKEAPLDRANSITELNTANLGAMAEMKLRIQQHYYDRIYLLVGSWYGEKILEEIKQNYTLESVVASPPYKVRAAFGFQDLMEDCRIFIPKRKD